MKVKYNKELEYCIEIYDSNVAMVFKVADAKALVESMNRAIAEAERDLGREQLTPFEDGMKAKELLKYRHWRCEIKEVGNEKPIVSELHGVYDEDDCVKHWGLRNADVEWYKLTEIEED